MPRTTVREKARQFVTEGMLGLVDKRSTSANVKEIGQSSRYLVADFPLDYPYLP